MVLLLPIRAGVMRDVMLFLASASVLIRHRYGGRVPRADAADHGVSESRNVPCWRYCSDRMRMSGSMVSLWCVDDAVEVLVSAVTCDEGGRRWRYNRFCFEVRESRAGPSTAQKPWRRYRDSVLATIIVDSR